MVNVRGKGGMKDINFVARIYDKRIDKDENGKVRTVYPEFSMDHRDPRAASQTNLNCRSVQVDYKRNPGKQTWENAQSMSVTQVEKILEVADKAPLTTQQGEVVGTIATFKADGQVNRARDGIIPKLDTLKEPEFNAYTEIREDQIASQTAAKEAREAARAEVKAAEAAAPEQQVEAAEPEVAAEQEAEEPSPVG